MTGKMDILDLVQELPDELTFDEVVRRLAELYAVPPKLLSPERSGNLTWGATFALKKSRVHEALQLLPDQLSGDDAIDDAIDRLYVVFRIELGLTEADEGKGGFPMRKPCEGLPSGDRNLVAGGRPYPGYDTALHRKGF